MKSTAFDVYHPSISVAFFVVVLVFCMAAMQPVYLVLSFVAALVCGIVFRGWRSVCRALAWQLPLVVLITVVNPLFSASGSTELFRIGLRAIYLESFIYGACMGVMLVTIFLWFSNAAQVLSSDKVMSVLGNATPTIALMISMMNRLLPQFVRRGKEIDMVNSTCLPQGKQTLRNKMEQRVRLVSVMMGWSMEDSLETADAMRSRGWGASRVRSTYQRYHFTVRDGVALGVLVFFAAVNAFLVFVACSQFHFYPKLSLLVWWWGYIPYVFLVLAPCILQLGEKLRWMR